MMDYTDTALYKETEKKIIELKENLYKEEEGWKTFYLLYSGLHQKRRFIFTLRNKGIYTKCL